MSWIGRQHRLAQKKVSFTRDPAKQLKGVERRQEVAVDMSLIFTDAYWDNTLHAHRVSKLLI